ncbi:unnamed protein product, partial [Discosporangium mesarthrocarpum]
LGTRPVEEGPQAGQGPEGGVGGDRVRIRGVSCGSTHTAAVSWDGRAWTWGSGLGGRLGHGDQAPVGSPRQVNFPVGVVVTSVACGSCQTLAITHLTQRGGGAGGSPPESASARVAV